jgi:putative transposase
MSEKGLPNHLVQRGNNRDACYLEPESHEVYLQLWREASRRNGVAANANCLMTNHVHFFVTPVDCASISNTTKVVWSCYAHYHHSVGDDRFRRQIEEKYGLRLGQTR